MAGFYSDGLELKGFIEGVPQLHDDVRFTYRPTLLDEGSELVTTVAAMKPRPAEQRWAKFVSEKLVRWDLRAPDGKGKLQDVAISPENVLRLNRRLFHRLLNVLLGNEAPDADPQDGQKAQEELAEATFRGPQG